MSPLFQGTTSSSWAEHQFISFDETPIHYYVSKPKEPPKAVIIIVHGMGEHAARYREFSEYLLDIGIQSYLPDLRGFGKSGGKRACIGNFWDYHEDLKALHAYVVRNHKDRPVFLMGHSFGGVITSSYLSFCPHAKIQGLVLSSPIFGIAVPVPLWRHWFGVLAAGIAPNHTEPTNVDSSLLTHDTNILDIYKKDPLIFQRISARLYCELQRMINRRSEIAHKLKEPVLLVQSGKDHVVSEEKALLFYQEMASSDKELTVYDDFYHEILNEVDRSTVYSRIGMWISRHINS